MNYFNCYIEIKPRAMNREDLKKFEKTCRNDPHSKPHFAGVKGSRYFFRFNTEVAKQSFMRAMEQQLVSLGFLTERQNPDLWQEVAPATPVRPLVRPSILLTA